jgi:hypothetical protein
MSWTYRLKQKISEHPKESENFFCWSITPHPCRPQKQTTLKAEGSGSHSAVDSAPTLKRPKVGKELLLTPRLQFEPRALAANPTAR